MSASHRLLPVFLAYVKRNQPPLALITTVLLMLVPSHTIAHLSPCSVRWTAGPVPFP